jgi:hypothetical protein
MHTKNEALPFTEFAEIVEVINVNFKPHPYVIGGRHVALASDKYGGMLTEDVLRQVPCASTGCTLSFDNHKSDKVAFVRLKRHTKQAELQEWLRSLLGWAEENKLDGFAFLEGFEIIPD